MSKGLTLIHGDKGGVGKSLTTMIYADYKLRNNEKPIIVDGDSRNPDVYRMFKSSYDTVYNLSLRRSEDWYEVSGLIEENPDRETIVSLPAGTEEMDIEMLESEMKMHKLPLNIYFLMNQSEDCINFLKELFVNLKDLNNFIIVKNLYFAKDSNSFLRFDKNDVRKYVIAQQIPIVELPVVTEKALAEAQSYNLPFHKIQFENIKDRSRIEQWLRKAHYALFEKPKIQKQEYKEKQQKNNDAQNDRETKEIKGV